MTFLKNYWCILLCISIGLSSSCARYIDSGASVAASTKVTGTPTEEIAVTSDWKRVRIGAFAVTGPPDLARKNVKGIDSEVYQFENRDFSVDVDKSSLLYGDDFEMSAPPYEHESGSLLIGGKPRRFLKFDLNRPDAHAATNADGSKARPVEKHFVIDVFIIEQNAVVSVSYREQSQDEPARAILRSLTWNKEKRT